MKRVILLITGIPVGIILVAAIILSVLYTPVYVYRLVTMNVADVYDYQYFINREIAASDDSFDFVKQPQEAWVESLFADKVLQTGCDDLDDWARKSQTTALLFIRRDTILYEKYFNGFSADSYFHSQSMAKSFISFLIGAAIDDSLIGNIDDPMTLYIPELKKRDAAFEKISIRNLLEMRSGLDYYEGHFPGTHIHLPWHDEAVGYYHPEVRKLLLEKVDVARPPGQTFQYCNYNTSYLGLIIERATGGKVSDYLHKKLWGRIMKHDALFSIDSEESGFEYMPSRLIARATDYARFGRLYLHDGNWNGEPIISRSWVKNSVQENKTLPPEAYPSWFGTNSCDHTYYGYQWWGHAECDSSWQFFASGNLGQVIYVIPDEEIIIVHCGNSNDLFSAYDLWHVADAVKYSAFHEQIRRLGVSSAIGQYMETHSDTSLSLPFSQRYIMDKGYACLWSGNTSDALKLFALNVQTFPHSWTVYNNMAEALAQCGEIDSAILYYQRSLQLRPGDNWATEKLKDLAP